MLLLATCLTNDIVVGAHNCVSAELSIVGNETPQQALTFLKYNMNCIYKQHDMMMRSVCFCVVFIYKPKNKQERTEHAYDNFHIKYQLCSGSCEAY